MKRDELGDISPFGQINADSGAFRSGIEFQQLRPEPGGFDADGGIRAGLMVRLALVDMDPLGEPGLETTRSNSWRNHCIGDPDHD